jgi:hypothetical protein
MRTKNHRIAGAGYWALIGIAVVPILSVATVIAAQTVASSTNAASDATTTAASSTTPIPSTTDDSATSSAAMSASTSTQPDTTGAATTTVTEQDSATTTNDLTTATSTALDMGTTTAETATSTPAVQLTCTMAYTSDLYDTPSGHAAPGATVIGAQAWTDCHDDQGHTYEFKLAPEQYAALSGPGATMPQEILTESSEQASVDSTTHSTDNATTTQARRHRRPMCRS